MALPTLETGELGRIPAAPESTLSPTLAARLPDVVPPAPWDCGVNGVIWMQRAGQGAAAVLPRSLRPLLQPRLALGAVLDYTDTPVAPYREVFAGLAQLRGTRVVTHVPFMAVDSVASVRGGRANWALPKTLAEFDGRPEASEPLGASGDGWWLSVRIRPLRPTIPLVMKLTGAQARPDGTVGTFRASLRGRMRPVQARIDASPDFSIARWMPPGRHLGTQWIGARFQVDPPESAT